MPLGLGRINAQQSAHPTERIVFIKALPGPGSENATDFLNRVAAICHPILKKHHVSVTTLEEHEWNPEFIGRNFNAGECIQLVLRSRSGSWLPFRSVVMVMMHELAHNAQMNHGRAFWAVRNTYASQMRELWARSYTGEGMWGRGRTLETGHFSAAYSVPQSEMPEQICGGTYRSRRRRRKRKRTVPEGETWKEAKERRTRKKFGENGQALGEERDVRMELERGSHLKGKPKVAQSKRSRDLRAAAALARLEKARVDVKDEGEKIKVEEETGEESGTGSETDVAAYVYGPTARNRDGVEVKDRNGRDMVKVCEDEEEDDQNVKEELQELRDLSRIPQHRNDPPVEGNTAEAVTHEAGDEEDPEITVQQSETSRPRHSDHIELAPAATATCPVCTVSVAAGSTTCPTCSHVLDPRRSAGSWKCSGNACNVAYRNPADFGRCGLCAAKKPD